MDRRWITGATTGLAGLALALAFQGAGPGAGTSDDTVSPLVTRAPDVRSPGPVPPEAQPVQAGKFSDRVCGVSCTALAAPPPRRLDGAAVLAFNQVHPLWDLPEREDRATFVAAPPRSTADRAAAPARAAWAAPPPPRRPFDLAAAARPSGVGVTTVVATDPAQRARLVPSSWQLDPVIATGSALMADAARWSGGLLGTVASWLPDPRG